MKDKLTCIVCTKRLFTDLFVTSDRMFDIAGDFFVKRCNNCGLVFVDPQPSQEVLKKHYPSMQYYSYQNEKTNDFFSVLRSYLIRHYYSPTLFSRIFSLLIQNVPALPIKNVGKILDVGCGTGDTLVLLQELGWEVYGLEIDKNAVSFANKRGLRNVRLGTYEDIENFPNNYFDAIRLYHVIEHLPNPALSLELIYKKLRPGGEVIMGTPNVDSVISKIFGKFWYNLDIPRHIFIFSPTSLAKLTKKHGFSNVRVDFCSAGGLIRSIIYVLGHLQKKKLDPNGFSVSFFFFYPLEWILDKIKMGDIMILRAVKQ